MVLIQSLLGGSKVVLMDEPTSGMDPESRRVLWNVMLGLFEGTDRDTSSNRSCVLTTHSLEEAEALCSRIAILLNGQICAIGITNQSRAT